ncbi:MAG: tetratricopeptide repeat protein, partial [Deltaproteobacteria bacterium]|nr:tetratricopeptide repeat protein [Deltaproteobacteria bacterium]
MELLAEPEIMKTYNGKGIPPLKKKLNNINWKNLQRLPLVRLCAGDIPEKKEYDGQIGLSLTRSDHRHIKHDICKPLPMPDNSVDSYQAEDVFEHIEYDKLLPIINEIYRVLKPNATFRLSVPDYGCDVLIDRSEKNTLGNIVFDPGGEIPNEPGHLWFPRIDKVKQLLEKSAFGKFGKIEYLHFYNMDGTFVVNKIDYSKGHIQRTPDFDKRVQNPFRPMSIVIDLVKNDQKMQEAIILNNKGEELFNKGDVEMALTTFKKAIEIEPNIVTAYKHLGVFYWQNGEVQKSIKHFKKVIKLDQNNRDVILSYGNILTDLGKIEDARNLYSSYLQKNPEGEEILSALRKLEGENFNDIALVTHKSKGKIFPVQSQTDEHKADFPVPFMDETEIKAICCCLKIFHKPINALEWGSGNSTTYFSGYLPEGSEWHSVEHNPKWVAYVQSLIDKLKLGCQNVYLHHVSCIGEFQEGSGDGCLETFRDYVLFPIELKKTFKIIIVDGRARIHCMKVGWQLLDNNGVMILHDA